MRCSRILARLTFTYAHLVVCYQWVPIGSTSLDVLGRGVVKMYMGHSVDQNGLSHPIDLEVEDVY